MKIAIVEDEEKACFSLRDMLIRYSKENGIESDIEIFKDGLVFLEKYQPVFDIVFMDIEMPYVDGMKASIQLRKKDTAVPLVFVTNLRQYALEGYHVGAMDFLIKPVRYSSLQTILDRIRQRTVLYGEEVMIKNQNGMYRIKVKDIVYLEVLSHYIIYHTLDGSYKFYGSLSEEVEKLPKKLFSFCSSCYLVNLSFVQKVEKDTVVVNDTELKISRRKKSEFLDALSRRFALM